MKIIFAFAFTLLFLTSMVYALEDKFVLDFHGFGSNQSVDIDLTNFLNPAATYYSNVPKFVNVKIDPKTKIATMTPKDPTWTGTESIIFGTTKTAVEETEKIEELKKEQTKVEPKTAKIINLTEKEITETLDPLIKEGFIHIVSELPKREVQIKSERSGKNFLIDLNNELKLNVSFYKSGMNIKPKFSMEMNLGEKNLATPEYQEKDYTKPALTAVIIFAILLIVIYLFFSSKFSLETIKNKKRELYERALKSQKDEFKSQYLKKIEEIKRGIQENGSSYKELKKILQEFLKNAYKIETADEEKIYSSLSKKETPKKIIKNIKIVFKILEEEKYTKRGITKQELINAANKIEQIIQAF